MYQIFDLISFIVSTSKVGHKVALSWDWLISEKNQFSTIVKTLALLGPIDSLGCFRAKLKNITNSIRVTIQCKHSLDSKKRRVFDIPEITGIH